jgi:hypothetical protein
MPGSSAGSPFPVSTTPYPFWSVPEVGAPIVAKAVALLWLGVHMALHHRHRTESLRRPKRCIRFLADFSKNAINCGFELSARFRGGALLQLRSGKLLHRYGFCSRFVGIAAPEPPPHEETP